MFEQRKSTERDGVLISDLSNHRFLRFYLSVFFFVLVSTKKIYKTIKTVFDYIYLEFFKNTDSAASRIFNGSSRCLVKHGVSCLIYYFTHL